VNIVTRLNSATNKTSNFKPVGFEASRRT